MNQLSIDYLCIIINSFWFCNQSLNISNTALNSKYSQTEKFLGLIYWIPHTGSLQVKLDHLSERFHFQFKMSEIILYRTDKKKKKSWNTHQGIRNLSQHKIILSNMTPQKI